VLGSIRLWCKPIVDNQSNEDGLVGCVNTDLKAFESNAELLQVLEIQCFTEVMWQKQTVLSEFEVFYPALLNVDIFHATGFTNIA